MPFHVTSHHPSTLPPHSITPPCHPAAAATTITGYAAASTT